MTERLTPAMSEPQDTPPDIPAELLTPLEHYLEAARLLREVHELQEQYSAGEDPILDSVDRVAVMGGMSVWLQLAMTHNRMAAVGLQAARQYGGYSPAERRGWMEALGLIPGGNEPELPG